MNKVKELNDFFVGVDAFNGMDYKKAHIIWEHNWKKIQISEDKLYLKPFIMLTGSYLNYYYGKNAGGKYLLQLALDRLLEMQNQLKDIVEVKPLINAIKHVYDRGGSAEGFQEIYIKKAG